MKPITVGAIKATIEFMEYLKVLRNEGILENIKEIKIEIPETPWEQIHAHIK